MKNLFLFRPALTILAIVRLSHHWQATAQFLIQDFVPGPNTYNNLHALTTIRDTVVNMANNEDLWKTDGTCTGTVRFKDFETGFSLPFYPCERPGVFCDQRHRLRR